MIQISVNNEKHQIAKTTSLEQLLQQLTIEKEKYAVAVNGEFVPRSRYSEHELHANDEVDILTAVQGG